jgi:hypothetical protein
VNVCDAFVVGFTIQKISIDVAVPVFVPPLKLMALPGLSVMPTPPGLFAAAQMTMSVAPVVSIALVVTAVELPSLAVWDSRT